MSGNGIKTSNSKDEIAKDKDKLTDKNDCSLKKVSLLISLLM